MKKVIEAARKDMLALQEGGVDGIMFSNEFSMPYLLKVKTETTASMARIIGELMHEISIPYGVNVLWDPYASLELAAAVDGKFVREIFSGVYASDFGLVEHQLRRNHPPPARDRRRKRQATLQHCPRSRPIPGAARRGRNRPDNRVQPLTRCLVCFRPNRWIRDRFDYLEESKRRRTGHSGVHQHGC